MAAMSASSALVGKSAVLALTVRCNCPLRSLPSCCFSAPRVKDGSQATRKPPGHSRTGFAVAVHGESSNGRLPANERASALLKDRTEAAAESSVDTATDGGANNGAVRKIAVQKINGTKSQKVEWWRMDIQNGAQSSIQEGLVGSVSETSEGSEASTASEELPIGPRGRTVCWMREAHIDATEEGETDVWAWERAHSNGSAEHSHSVRLESRKETSHVESFASQENGSGHLLQRTLTETVATVSSEVDLTSAADDTSGDLEEGVLSTKKKGKKGKKKSKRNQVKMVADGYKKKKKHDRQERLVLQLAGAMESTFVDENGVKLKMYPSPGYIDRLDSAQELLGSPAKDEEELEGKKKKHRKESSNGKVSDENGAVQTAPETENLAQRLKHLRKKAIEHKDRHSKEKGTLVVPTKQPILVLMRHGQSMWNELKLFTGDVDIPLTEKGVMEALSGGRTIKDVDFDIIFTSRLLRAKQTAMLAMTQNTSNLVPVLVRGGYHGEGRIGDGNRLRLRESATYALDKAACKMVPVYAHPALNERCYGDLQGLNKEEAAKEFGKELVQQWRRSNNTSPPGGESLVDTARRAKKYYVEVIEPRLKEGKNVLLVTHGNVMRGLIAHLASLQEEEMLTLEIATAFPYAYAFSTESGDYAQCCLMKPMEDFITGEPLEGKPMGIASVLKKKNFDSLI